MNHLKKGCRLKNADEQSWLTCLGSFLFQLCPDNNNNNNNILFANLKCSDISRAIPQKAELVEAGS